MGLSGLRNRSAAKVETTKVFEETVDNRQSQQPQQSQPHYQPGQYQGPNINNQQGQQPQYQGQQGQQPQYQAQQPHYQGQPNVQQHQQDYYQGQQDYRGDNNFRNVEEVKAPRYDGVSRDEIPFKDAVYTDGPRVIYEEEARHNTDMRTPQEPNRGNVNYGGYGGQEPNNPYNNQYQGYDQRVDEHSYSPEVIISPEDVRPNHGYNQYNEPLYNVEVRNRYPQTNYKEIVIPDKQGRDLIGCAPTDKVEIISYAASDIKPIVLSNIVDRTGAISKRLKLFMNRYGVTVIPLREAGVFENISKVEDFEIKSFEGKTYASYTGRDYNFNFINKLSESIVDKLSSATCFGWNLNLETFEETFNIKESRIIRTLTINGIDIEVPGLCESELEFLSGRFSMYNFTIFTVNDSFRYISVGKDLKGINPVTSQNI